MKNTQADQRAHPSANPVHIARSTARQADADAAAGRDIEHSVPKPQRETWKTAEERTPGPSGVAIIRKSRAEEDAADTTQIRSSAMGWRPSLQRGARSDGRAHPATYCELRREGDRDGTSDAEARCVSCRRLAVMNAKKTPRRGWRGTGAEGGEMSCMSDVRVWHGQAQHRGRAAPTQGVWTTVHGKEV